MIFACGMLALGGNRRPMTSLQSVLLVVYESFEETLNPSADHDLSNMVTWGSLFILFSILVNYFSQSFQEFL